MLTALRRGLIALLAIVPLFAHALTSPHDVIKTATDQLLAGLKTNKTLYSNDSAAFYKFLDGIFTPVVDIEGISRSIMTVKYSKNATPAQMKRFEETFKRSLFHFYGNALLEYNDQDIRVLPEIKQTDPERATVKMEIVGKHNEIYPVEYTMVKLDQWRMRNVIVNGINIGKLFRDQFDESMSRNGGNLDKTIDTWGEVVGNAKDTIKSEQNKASAK